MFKFGIGHPNIAIFFSWVSEQYMSSCAKNFDCVNNFISKPPDRNRVDRRQTKRTVIFQFKAWQKMIKMLIMKDSHPPPSHIESAFKIAADTSELWLHSESSRELLWMWSCAYALCRVYGGCITIMTWVTRFFCGAHTCPHAPSH